MMKQVQKSKDPGPDSVRIRLDSSGENPDPSLSRSVGMLFEVARKFLAHHRVVRQEVLLDVPGLWRYFIWEREDGAIVILCQFLGKPSGFRHVSYRSGKSFEEEVKNLSARLESRARMTRDVAEGA